MCKKIQELNTEIHEIHEIPIEIQALNNEIHEIYNIPIKIGQDVESYKSKISLLEKEIINTMKNPLKDSDILLNWTNKCKAINEKKKAIKRLKNAMIRFLKLTE